jgi:spore coat protein CotF
MNNNQISNPKVEVNSGISLNDKDYITCLLTTLKEMSKNYVVAMTEASNEELYNIYKDSFLNIISLQREVYELMFRKGWYVLENVDVSKINTKYNTLLQEYQDLSN